jgi:hypothetical protein
MLISMQHVQATYFLKKLKVAKKKYKTRKERYYHSCLTLVATALLVGTDISRLAKRTGYRKSFVSAISDRMHLASLWNGDQSELDEWADSDFMLTIFAHASVASGTGGREIHSDGTLSYFDLI